MIKIITLFLFGFLLISNINAQGVKSDINDNRIYIGIKGGQSYGVSTFSSFGHNKDLALFSGALYGGYRLTPIFSVEASASYGKTSMSERECCIDKGYWLGIDGVRYGTVVSGMDGWKYADLKSEVNIQKYGAQLNINLLGLCLPSTQRHWSVNISPAMYLVGTKATVKTISENHPILKEDYRWHLGVGGDVMAEYLITPKLSLGIYTGINYLTGKSIDGMPKHLHKNNYIWESGIRLGWRFSCRKAKSATPIIAMDQFIPTIDETEIEKITAEPSPATKEIPDSIKEETTLESIEEKEVASVKLAFPTISFSFNSVWIEPEQRNAIKIIAEILRSHPKININITGYTDNVGGAEINQRISLLRAKAVEKALEAYDIDKERITTIGGGIYPDTTSRIKARNATTIQQTK